MKAIYRGDRDFPDNYDNFTLGGVYEYAESRNYDDSGLIVVVNDLGDPVHHLGIDFDFMETKMNPTTETIRKTTIEVYSPESYSSFQDAHAHGAIYSRNIDTPTTDEAITAAALAVSECLGGSIAVRVVSSTTTKTIKQIIG